MEDRVVDAEEKGFPVICGPCKVEADLKADKIRVMSEGKKKLVFTYTEPGNRELLSVRKVEFGHANCKGCPCHHQS